MAAVDTDRTEEEDAVAADNEAAEDADETVEDDEDTRVGLPELEFAFKPPANRAASGDGEKRPVGSMCGGARTGVGMPCPVTA